MSGWDVIMEQKGSLLTFFPLPPQTNHTENDKLAWCLGTFIFKTLIRLLTCFY